MPTVTGTIERVYCYPPSGLRLTTRNVIEQHGPVPDPSMVYFSDPYRKVWVKVHSVFSKRHLIALFYQMAEGEGFEPSVTGPKPAALPLGHPSILVHFPQRIIGGMVSDAGGDMALLSGSHLLSLHQGSESSWPTSRIPRHSASPSLRCHHPYQKNESLFLTHETQPPFPHEALDTPYPLRFA